MTSQARSALHLERLTNARMHSGHRRILLSSRLDLPVYVLLADSYSSRNSTLTNDGSTDNFPVQ